MKADLFWEMGLSWDICVLADCSLFADYSCMRSTFKVY